MKVGLGHIHALKFFASWHRKIKFAGAPVQKLLNFRLRKRDIDTLLNIALEFPSFALEYQGRIDVTCSTCRCLRIPVGPATVLTNIPTQRKRTENF